MERDELVELLQETLLWEAVGAYVEQPDQAAEMVDDLGYLEDGVADDISWCEVLDSDEFEVGEAEVVGDRLCLSFEMPFVLTAWHTPADDPKESVCLLRITSTIAGECRIPDVDAYEWEDVDWEDADASELREHLSLVQIGEHEYQGTEADSCARRDEDGTWVDL